MSNNFIEGTDGQLSFFTDSVSLLNESELKEPYIIEFIKNRIKKFQSKLILLKKYKEEKYTYGIEIINKSLKKEFDEFIDSFLELYHKLSIEEILFIQENYASLYHQLCKLFLDYLKKYIFNIKETYCLEDGRIIELENLIFMDQVAFRDIEYKNIKAIIEKRNKLRVNNYLIFDGEALLKRLNMFITRESTDMVTKDLKNDITSLVTSNYTSKIFTKLDYDFIEKEQRSTLSMLLLYYLDKCVYHNLEEELPRSMIEKLELYIVYNFSDSFLLSECQERTYKIVKTNVSKKLSNYIKKESETIKKQLKDYELLKEIKESKKYMLIEQSDDMDDLPLNISEDEIRLNLENFLETVFMLSGSLKKDNLPIFLEEMKKERHICMTIALEYLKRFVYKYANVGSEWIFTLEEYINAEKDFVLTDSSLCLVKSKLYGRVSRRYIIEEAERKRKLLQTKTN